MALLPESKFNTRRNNDPPVELWLSRSILAGAIRICFGIVLTVIEFFFRTGSIVIIQTTDTREHGGWFVFLTFSETDLRCLNAVPALRATAAHIR